MKNQELFLASALIAIVAGGAAALATRALGSGDVRESKARSAEPQAVAPSTGGSLTSRELDDLRMENVALTERLSALEARLAELQSTRTPAMPNANESVATRPADDAPGSALRPDPAFEVTPAFVASVGKALDTIHAREEAEREAKRKELQAQRVEERVAKLQQELGLSNRQATDVRTALIAQDDKREALFLSMRDGLGDPRDMRDSFRTIRDETHASLQTILTADQFAGYLKTEESDFARRGPPDFGGARPFEGDPNRGGDRRQGR